MPAGLQTLPYDILFSIIEYLNLEDAVHFGLCSPPLNAVVQESTLCRKVVQTAARYSQEAALAERGQLSYESALLHLYSRRTAFRKCEPHVVKALAKAESFIYSCGVLCTLREGAIHVQDLTKARTPGGVIDLTTLHLKDQELSYGPLHTVRLLAVHGQTIAIWLQANGDIQVDQLAALAWDNEGNYKVIFARYLDSSDELFVRMNDSYLYYGTHSGIGERNHHEWVIRGVALQGDNKKLSDYKLQLEKFVGYEIGSTVEFKLHHGYFYAVSNQTKFEVEEVDWTSFYTAVRFPLGSTSEEDVEINRSIYRRQHADGPIHDSWTTLSLQHDECSECLYIVESRREWLNGGSKQTRTFYRHLVEFQSEDDLWDSMMGGGPGVTMPADDVLSSVVTSDNHPRYAPPQELEADQVHPEYGHADDRAPAFIIAKTRLRNYDFSSSAFVDLVEDNSCCGLNSICLRLRIGSRVPAPLQPLLQDCSVTGAEKQPARDEYRYTDISMWPPTQSSGVSEPSGASDAHRAMNPHLLGTDAPPAYLGLQITACSDERSVVYMVKPARPRNDAERLGTIVFISFDPSLAKNVLLPLGDDVAPESCLTDTAEWSRSIKPWSTIARSL